MLLCLAPGDGSQIVNRPGSKLLSRSKLFCRNPKGNVSQFDAARLQRAINFPD